MVNGTLVNYYVHCKRQCYLHGNHLNLEDNSELVKVGKAIHEEKNNSTNSEIEIENIKIDKLTKDYVIEIKKSDADIEAARWQLLYYLMVLKEKGLARKGKIEVVEKNKNDNHTMIIELTQNEEHYLHEMIHQIEILVEQDTVPDRLENAGCKKCAYYEYCYI